MQREQRKQIRERGQNREDVIRERREQRKAETVSARCPQDVALSEKEACLGSHLRFQCP